MKGKPGKACLCMFLLLVSMIHFGSQAYAQKPTSRMITVIGNVSDESGEPLAGVSVMLQGTKIGVSTDADGNYTIRFLPRKDQENIIVYSFIGMEEQTFNAKASVQNDVILKSLDSELDQVVVNGFYTQKKSTFTGAATTIKGETLVELSPTNLLAGIAAMTPGMVLVENNAAGSNPNAIPSLLIRGASSLITNESEEGVNNPLIILDGVELKTQIARYTGKLDDTFDAIIDGTSKATGGELLIEKNTSYTPVRWNDGALITDVGQLEYSCNIPETFSIGFWFKNTAPLTDCIIAELRGNSPGLFNYIAVKDMTFTVDSYEAQHLGADGIWRNITLYIGYDKRTNSFYVRDTVNDRVLSLQIDITDRDWLFFGLSQSTDKRLFFIREFDLDITKYVKAFVPPCGQFNRIFFNPKE